MMSKAELKRLLIERAFDLLYNRVPSGVDAWFEDELKTLTVKQYFDDEFMEDWREQRRIETYNLIAEIKEEFLESFQSLTSKAKNNGK